MDSKYPEISESVFFLPKDPLQRPLLLRNPAEGLQRYQSELCKVLPPLSVMVWGGSAGDQEGNTQPQNSKRHPGIKTGLAPNGCILVSPMSQCFVDNHLTGPPKSSSLLDSILGTVYLVCGRCSGNACSVDRCQKFMLPF